MADQASAWSAAAAVGRFGGADLPEELAMLARSLDEMLARTAAVLRHEQHLTGELSHELRTPLSRILAETELLDAAGPDDAVAVQNIRSTALHMSSLLDTLLTAARATPAATPGRCDLREVVTALEEVPRPEGVVLETVVPPTGPLVVGADRGLVERLLHPLLENAFRYARSSVVLAAVPEPTGEVTIEVVDDGPGVPSEVGERVFDPGIRGDPEDGHDGAGLGLPLARRLARAAGGSVDLCASPRTRTANGGAVFRVTLPAG
jgi:signal transduction histidine kinase